MDAQTILEAVEQFLNSETLDFAVKGVLLYIALLWVALIVWVTKDITNRTNNIVYQVVSILLIILGTPLFGLIIYLIIRPSQTLMDSYYEELESELLEQEAFIMQLKLEREAGDHPEAKERISKIKTRRAPRKKKSVSEDKESSKDTTEKSNKVQDTSLKNKDEDSTS